MNFMGMGSVEIAVIFLVAFLALGPAKSIEMARTAGKFVREMQRTFHEMMASVNLDELKGDPDSKSPGQPRQRSDPPERTDNRDGE